MSFIHYLIQITFPKGKKFQVIFNPTQLCFLIMHHYSGIQYIRTLIIIMIKLAFFQE